MKNAKRIIILLIFLAQTASAEKIVFETSTRYKKNEDVNFIEVKAGENIELSPGESMIAISKQGLPVVIYSSQSKDHQLTIKNSNFNQMLRDELQPLINQAVEEVISGTRKAETLVQKRDYQQALTIITALKDKYPHISTVLFMSGTIYFLLGNKTAAAEDLEKGVQLDSDNVAAKRLLEKLKGSAK